MRLLLKFVLLSHVISFTRPASLFALLVLMSVFSKWTMVVSMRLGISARKDGLGSIFIEESTLYSFIFSSILLIGFSAAVGSLLVSEYGLTVLSLFLIQSSVSFM